MILEITRKKLFLIGSFVVVLIAIPLTVYITQKQQETRSQASEVLESRVVAIINGEQITKAEVRKVAEEQNAPSAVDAQALKDGLSTLEERKILEIAAEELGIGPSQELVIERAAQDGVSEIQARYEVLREIVILAKVKSRQALSIEFWNPPQSSRDSLTAEEKENADNELSDGIPALAEAETGIRSGENIMDIGQSLITRYPSLAPVLGVNGYILSELEETEKEKASMPQIYEFGDSSLDRITLSALFAMEVGEVKSVTNTSSNRGGTVFKLVSKGNEGGELSYEDWLDKQKRALVEDLGVL